MSEKLRLWSRTFERQAALLTVLLISVLRKADTANVTYFVHNTRCLTNNSQIDPANLRFLVYPDGTSSPVNVPYANRPSGRVVGEIAYILLSEVMGYSAVLADPQSIFSAQVMNWVAGCLDPDDVSCTRRDVDHPRIHMSIETWNNGAIRANNLPSDVRPQLVGLLDYSLTDEFYIWQDTLDQGWSAPEHEWLNFYGYYDAAYHKPHQYFDPVQKMLDLVPQRIRVPCSKIFSTGYQQSPYTSVYFKYSNDKVKTCAFDDTVWISMACRNNISQCIPLMVMYNFDFAIQITYFMNIPVALLMVDGAIDLNYIQYYSAVRKGRFLFHSYTPDDSLVDENGQLPVIVQFPQQDRQAQLKGLYKTGKADFSPRNYVWSKLPDVDNRVSYFTSKVNFEFNDMNTMMLQSSYLLQAQLSAVDVARQVACNWVKLNQATWSGWIPITCPKAYHADGGLTKCLSCTAGSFCAGGIAGPVTCPIGFYCPPNVSAPIPCGSDRITVGTGSSLESQCSECKSGDVKIMGVCVAFVVLFPSVIAPFVIISTITLCKKRRDHLTGDERLLHTKVEELRRRFRIRKRDGYLLSSERAPIWHRVKAFTIIQYMHIEAAAQLDMFREDFDIKHVDSFCMYFEVHGDSEQRMRLRDWILELSRFLLEPFDQPLQRVSQSIPSQVEWYARSLVVPQVNSAEAMLSKSTQETRFAYFKSKVARLACWHEEDALKELKEVVDVFLDKIGEMCDERFQELLTEPDGLELSSFDATICGKPRRNSVVTCYDLSSDAPELELSPPLACMEPARLGAEATKVGKIPPSSKGMASLRDENCVFVRLPSDPVSNGTESACLMTLNGGMICRQDHPKVGAIRIYDVDRKEAEMQTMSSKAENVVGQLRSWREQRIHVSIDEEVFLSQLSLRAKLLNEPFQLKIIDVVRRMGEVQRPGDMRRSSSQMTGENMVTIDCSFNGVIAPVEVHSAAIKTVARMREKIFDYVYPNPRGIWPLSANILDPVRLSIVCTGPSQMLQVLRWITDRELETGLPVCRVKNGFSPGPDTGINGYRDIKVCVIFKERSGLGIIGEIQIHDRCLHSLKLKMHKLYTIKRINSAAGFEN